MTLDEIRRLDPKKIGSWPVLPKITLLVIVLLVMIGASYWFDWKGQTEQIDAEKAKEGQLKTTFVDKKKKALDLPAYRKQLEDIEKQFGALLDITLVESEEIGTVGVGESTVPPITTFHNLLGIDEREFMRECAATFKVAIWFENWGKQGDWYLHPFGRHGQPTWIAEFYNYWLYARSQGLKVPLGEYCYEWLAAVKDKFALRENPRVMIWIGVQSSCPCAPLMWPASSSSSRRSAA